MMMRALSLITVVQILHVAMSARKTFQWKFFSEERRARLRGRGV